MNLATAQRPTINGWLRRFPPHKLSHNLRLMRLIYILILMPFVSLNSSLGNPESITPAKSTAPWAMELARLDELFDGVFDYTKQCYQAEVPGQIGGFHWAPSSKEDPDRFPAYLESTQWAMRLFAMAEADLPDTLRESVLAFARSRQSPDGFFRSGVPCIDADRRLLSRNLSSAVAIFRLLEAEPQYPLPANDAQADFPEMESPAAFRAWLEGLDWDQPWRAGDSVSSRSALIGSVAEPLRSQLVETTVRFLAQIQSPVTGLWGNHAETVDGQTISGGMKLTGFFKRFQRPVPNMEQLLATNLTFVQRDDFDGNMILWIRNPINTLMNLETLAGHPLLDDEQRSMIVRQATRALRKFKLPNGGFIRNPGIDLTGPWPESQNHACNMSFNRPEEGNLNSVASGAEATRTLLYALCGQSPPLLPNTRDVFSDWSGTHFSLPQNLPRP